MAFTNVINPRSHIPRKHEFKETLVKKGATVGANATIVCGHTIGRYAFERFEKPLPPFIL